MTRKCRPHVILIHWPGDLYNPDHRVTGQKLKDVAIITTVLIIVTENPGRRPLTGRLHTRQGLAAWRYGHAASANGKV
ncbi:hypothetical protein [Paenibacillus nasutitermitis]|uniref:hypothetical protein n=1 Tax=Paenibacillus nasutitermitis TaxID=1652958 RepID=UPI001665282E|nr:hypothetical protein [Paenibacillus nasutitermitis]